MMLALAIDEFAANRLSLAMDLPDDWVGTYTVTAGLNGITRVKGADCVYLLDSRASHESRLLVLATNRGASLDELPLGARIEAFFRILRAALSSFQAGVTVPPNWLLYHRGSLLSFQSNRLHTGITARVYVDFAPEGTNHVFAYAINFSNRDALDRRGYSSDAFTKAVLGFDDVLCEATKPATLATAGNVVVNLTSSFSEDNILNGLPFSTWISRLTVEQAAFFTAKFDGPLRVRGPAGSGKTLVLTLAFLKHVYQSIDNNKPINSLFLAHGEEPPIIFEST